MATKGFSVKLLAASVMRTATFRHSAISFLGTFLTGVLGLVFYAYVARTMGPNNYGVFALAVTTIALVSSIANIGTDTGIIRFVSEANRDNKKRALQFLKLGFELKLVVWIAILLLGCITMPFIVQLFWGKSELITPLRISLFGVGGMLMSSFALAGLQAYSRFTAWSVVNVAANVVRLLSVVAIGISGMLAIDNALWIYGGVLFLMSGYIFVSLLPNFFKVSGELSLKGEFLHFNKWVAIFTTIAAIGSRLDTYLSAKYLTLSEVGAYSVGVSLVSFVTQIVLALGSVVAPKLAGMDNRQAIKYLKKVQLFVFVLAIGGLIVGIPLGIILIPLIYGVEYSQSIAPFIILLIAQAIFLLSVPAHMAVLYYFSKPKIFVYVTGIHLITTFVLGTYLIQSHGIVGASIAALVGTIFDFLIPLIWVVKKLFL